MPKRRTFLVTVLLALTASPPAASAGDGTFPDSLSASLTTHPGADSVVVGDFNADGRDDLAVGTYGGIDVLLGTPDGTLSLAAGSPLVTFASEVAVGDFNNDGKEDLVAAGPSDGAGHSLAILLGNSNGTFGAASNYYAGSYPASLAIGDFNADGNEDVAVSDFDPGALEILLGAGNGTMTSQGFTPVGTRAGALAIGDFNNDGIQDLALVNSLTTTDITGHTSTVSGVGILRGNGNGAFGPASHAINGTFAGIAVGDFNADGHEDIAASDFDSDEVRIRLGTGTGDFAAAGSPGAGSGPQAIAVGDFNSDGRDDLAVVDSYGSNVTILLGAGTGGFTAAPGFPITGSAPQSIAVGDFDADGNVDLAIPSRNYGAVTIRRGAGAPPLAGNLLTNGGVEGPSAVHLFASAPVAIPGWQSTGNMTYAGYGMPTNTYGPDALASARIDGGDNYLYPGYGADATAFQTVDVSESAASIDAGLARTTLSADLGGGNIYQDRMKARASLLDGSGSELGSFDIGPVTNTDRHNLNFLLPRSATQPVPAGTRAITVALIARDDAGDYNGATADNIKLTLDAPPPPVPEPTPTADTTAPDTTKGKGPPKRTTRHTATFKFSSEQGATFECKLDKKDFAPCTSPKKVKHLKLGKHVFQVEATDAAGNTDPSPARWRWRVVPKPS